MIDIPQLAWMAGILDMKGKLRVVDVPTRCSPLYIATVESSRLTVIRRLASYTGSRPEYFKARALVTRSRRGCAEHCPEPHQHVRPVLPGGGRWHISGAGAVIVLQNLLPFFVTENEDREKFIADARNSIPASGRGRHAVDQSIKRLAGIGWTIPDGLSRCR
jgi:hypothetical protein